MCSINVLSKKQEQKWVPNFRILGVMGHNLSKITSFFPKRCSCCGYLVNQVCSNIYLCRCCGIFCHSTCVGDITKSCKEVQAQTIDMRGVLQVQGHNFEERVQTFQKRALTLKEWVHNSKKCAKCKNLVTSSIDKSLQCIDCKLILHDSCTALLQKNCQSLYVSRACQVRNDGISLLSQNYRCPDCNTHILGEFQDCQYSYSSKQFFCLKCYSKREDPISDNVVQKYSSCPHPVSDRYQLFLNYMENSPVIAAQNISENVMPFKREIRNILFLLEEIRNYYDYLVECQKEFDDILQQMRRNWPKLMEIPQSFSISNLKKIFESFEGDTPRHHTVYTQLVECHEKIIQHVRKECQKLSTI